MATSVKLQPIRLSAEHGEYLTRSEAADRLRVSKAHLSNLVRGKVAGMPGLRCCRVGRRMIFRLSWIDEFIEATASGGVNDDNI
ncbi:MAG: helix-turn-helix domain-containing protein [Acidobacteriia bacterium]|nr:helix-turn-helix domain-containing protein [Terriglobia bacterium]